MGWEELCPVGSIIPWCNGIFDQNEKMTAKLDEQYLSDNWRICDGSFVKDPDSPLFREGGYLPNLRDRFVMGAEIQEVGNQGGTSDSGHKHLTDKRYIKTDLRHSHNMKHTHDMDNHVHKWADGKIDKNVNPMLGLRSTSIRSTNAIEPGKKRSVMSKIVAQMKYRFFTLKEADSSPGKHNVPGNNAEAKKGTYYTYGNIGAEETSEQKSSSIYVKRGETSPSLKQLNAGHNHTTVAQKGGQDNNPPYISMVYIMRIK